MTVLSKLINITWKTGQLPTVWKTAVVIPLVKKNEAKSAPSSYKTISLTSCTSKGRCYTFKTFKFLIVYYNDIFISY